MVQIVALCGSLRKDSFNMKLLRAFIPFLQDAGASVALVDLNEYPLPLFSEDVESSAYPQKATQLRTVLAGAKGFLIVTPEYNAAIPGVLKNAIDWASRENLGDALGDVFSGKVVGVASASISAFGGIRVVHQLSLMLHNMMDGMHVLPRHVMLPSAHKAFDAQGRITDGKTLERMNDLAKELVSVTEKVRGSNMES